MRPESARTMNTCYLKAPAHLTVSLDFKHSAIQKCLKHYQAILSVLLRWTLALKSYWRLTKGQMDTRPSQTTFKQLKPPDPASHDHFNHALVPLSDPPSSAPLSSASMIPPTFNHSLCLSLRHFLRKRFLRRFTSSSLPAADITQKQHNPVWITHKSIQNSRVEAPQIVLAQLHLSSECVRDDVLGRLRASDGDHNAAMLWNDDHKVGSLPVPLLLDSNRLWLDAG